MMMMTSNSRHSFLIVSCALIAVACVSMAPCEASASGWGPSSSSHLDATTKSARMATTRPLIQQDGDDDDGAPRSILGRIPFRLPPRHGALHRNSKIASPIDIPAILGGAQSSGSDVPQQSGDVASHQQQDSTPRRRLSLFRPRKHERPSPSSPSLNPQSTRSSGSDNRSLQQTGRRSSSSPSPSSSFLRGPIASLAFLSKAGSAIQRFVVFRSSQVQAFVSTLIAHIRASPKHFLLPCVAVIQIGLVGYMVFDIIKTGRRLWNELADELGDNDSTNSALLVHPNHLQMLLSYMYEKRVYDKFQERKRSGLMPTVDGVEPSMPMQPKYQHVPPVAVDLASRLMQCGVPIFAPEPRGNGSATTVSSLSSSSSSSQNSVQSIFQQLTKTQAGLLSTMLTVPNSNRNFHSVSGLYSVKTPLYMWLTQQRLQQRQRNSQLSPFFFPSQQQQQTQQSRGKNDDESIAQTPPAQAFQNFVQSSNGIDNPATSGDKGKASASPSQGILLYGPPGCGKSLIIQALSTEMAPKIPLTLTPSVLQNKWYGESAKTIRTLFQLMSATLKNDCVLIIDELDGLFRQRSSSDDGGYSENEASRDIKTEFLQWWDGAAASSSSTNANQPSEGETVVKNTVVVIAATNRPFDVDPAVLRRLPWSFFVGLPNGAERQALLEHWRETFGLPISSKLIAAIRHVTEGYSPSDMYRLVQVASTIGPLSTHSQQTMGVKQHNDEDIRLTISHVMSAKNQVPPTRLPSQYIQQLCQFMQVGNQTPTGYGLQQQGGDRQGQQDSDSSSSPYLYDEDDDDDDQQEQHDIWKWETEYGDFYHFGQVMADHFQSNDLDKDYSAGAQGNGSSSLSWSRNFHVDQNSSSPSNRNHHHEDDDDGSDDNATSFHDEDDDDDDTDDEYF